MVKLPAMIHTAKSYRWNIVEKTREDYIQEGLITLETEKEKARAEKRKSFNALDLYDKAVLRRYTGKSRWKGC